MTNPRTFRAKNPTDLLAMVPCVLGFHPDNSIVLLTLGGGEDRFHARVDLPHQDSEVTEVVGTLHRAAARHGADRVVLMAYSDDHDEAAALCSRLREALESTGTTVVEAVRADGRRWYSLSCTDSCCPAEGTPYDLSTHPFTVQSVLDGKVTLGSRQELADSLVGTDQSETDAVARAAGDAADRFAAASRHPLGAPDPKGARRHLVQEGQWVAERVRRFLDDRVRLTAEEAGRMLVALGAVEVRDVAWAEMTRANAERHVDLWRDLVRRAPQERAAPPAALLGFAAWLSGHGALAWCAVERCQAAEADYRMAALLTDALAAGMSPTRWRPISAAELPLFAS